MITAEDIRGIMPELELTDAQVEIYIKSASVFLNNAMQGVSVSEELNTELLRWLTAHLIAATVDRPVVQQKAGEASQTFSDIFDVGLKSTMYGQTALAMDTTGALAAASGGSRAWLYAVKTK